MPLEYDRVTVDHQKPHNTNKPIQPVLIPTFPGGSSDLMKLLIEASTGIWTGNQYRQQDVIAIKTHYPYYHTHTSIEALEQYALRIKREGVVVKVDDENDSRFYPVSAVVVIRDPLDTMETWHTYIQNSLNTKNKRSKEEQHNSKSTSKWIEWRDRHFEEELKKWTKFHSYWLNEDKIKSVNRHVTIYEDLIDFDKGPKETIEFVSFLHKMTNVPLFMQPDQIPCIWYKVLQLKTIPYQHDQQSQQPQAQQQQSQQQLQPNTRRRRKLQTKEEDIDQQSLPSPTSLRPYTYLQLDKVASVLTTMIEEHSHNTKALSALMKYRSTIMQRMSFLKGNDSNPILVENVHGTCIDATPKYEKGIIPIFQASYPGSGSQMMRDLIEGITGYKTTEGKRRNDVVAIKTLYPYRKHDLSPGYLNRDMKRLVLLIRYPLNAISSNFAHIYWAKNKITPHSSQPPKKEWIKWRDANIDREIDAWIDHFMYWVNSFKPANRMFVTYEAMYHSEKGPKQAMRLAYFIKGSAGGGTEIDPAPAFTVPCLWFRAVRVNDQADTDVFQANRHHRNSQYIASYTSQQLEMVATKINLLYKKFNYDLQLGPILQGYWEHTISFIESSGTAGPGSRQ